MPPAIDDETSRICVDGAEQRPERVVKADDENRCTQGLKIFRHEAHPEFFSRTDHERGDEKNNKVTFESEEFAGSAPKVHQRSKGCNIVTVFAPGPCVWEGGLTGRLLLTRDTKEPCLHWRRARSLEKDSLPS